MASKGQNGTVESVDPMTYVDRVFGQEGVEGFRLETSFALRASEGEASANQSMIYQTIEADRDGETYLNTRIMGPSRDGKTINGGWI